MKERTVYLPLRPVIQFPLEHNKTVSAHLSRNCSMTLKDKVQLWSISLLLSTISRKRLSPTGCEVLSVQSSVKMITAPTRSCQWSMSTSPALHRLFGVTNTAGKTSSVLSAEVWRVLGYYAQVKVLLLCTDAAVKFSGHPPTQSHQPLTPEPPVLATSLIINFKYPAASTVEPHSSWPTSAKHDHQ